MDDVSTTFAMLLRALREQAGLSQYALAKKSGLTKQAISRLEAGTRDPAWETVQRLAHALGVDCTAFANVQLEMPPEEPTKPRGRPKKVAEPPEQPSGKKPKKPGKKKGG